MQDEHLINHFVKNNLLKPVVDAFVGNGNRYNLLNSAVLELFEYIRKVHFFTHLFSDLLYLWKLFIFYCCLMQENLKSLLRYVVDSFWNQLVNFEYLPSIHSLKVKYEQVCTSLQSCWISPISI